MLKASCNIFVKMSSVRIFHSVKNKNVHVIIDLNEILFREKMTKPS